MPMPEVVALLIDDDNEDKFGRHGVSVEQVLQVVEIGSIYRIKRNRGGRRASHLLVGRDRQGRCLAIPIEATNEPGVWRPVTAWRCKHSEAAWLP